MCESSWYGMRIHDDPMIPFLNLCVCVKRTLPNLHLRKSFIFKNFMNASTDFVGIVTFWL